MVALVVIVNDAPLPVMDRASNRDIANPLSLAVKSNYFDLEHPPPRPVG